MKYTIFCMVFFFFLQNGNESPCILWPIDILKAWAKYDCIAYVLFMNLVWLLLRRFSDESRYWLVWLRNYLLPYEKSSKSTREYRVRVKPLVYTLCCWETKKPNQISEWIGRHKLNASSTAYNSGKIHNNNPFTTRGTLHRKSNATKMPGIKFANSTNP